MLAYLARRLGQNMVTLFLIVTLAFFLVQAQPGITPRVYAQDPKLTPEVRAQIQEDFGLDKPLGEQYLVHLRNSFTGNFGISFGHYPRSVMSVIVERAPRTAVLFLTATIISFYIGFVQGKTLAWRRGGPLEVSMTVSPAPCCRRFSPPWYALMMIWLFAFQMGWFPLGKFLDPLLWRDAHVTADYVFNRMLLTGGAFMGFIMLVMLASRWTERSGFRARFLRACRP